MAKTDSLMDTNALPVVRRLVEIEVREQLNHIPSSYRKYLSGIDFQRLINSAIDRLPRSFRTLGEKYHDSETRRLRVKIAVEKALAEQLQELKLYYVPRTEVEGEDEIPTASFGELYFSR
ncbi:hypothetical protein V0288_03900 [Pannus brasiliensis CCIBt3594]|uniref:Uncharacterized protein n=1 Tax=Pannus brasiliensis CCIBt3594 TaxID=1427578 RepID=A0AAW9QQG7_9CHRO